MIKRHVNTLTIPGWVVNIIWTPGHSVIQENDIADILAKETATEASLLPEDTRMVTNEDIKQAAKKTMRRDGRDGGSWQRLEDTIRIKALIGY